MNILHPRSPQMKKGDNYIAREKEMVYTRKKRKRATLESDITR